MKQKKLKKILIAVLVSVVLSALLIPNMIYRMNEKLVEQDMIVEDIDVSFISEKTFNGSYSTAHMSAAVEVTVVNGQYTDITLTGYSGINPSRAQYVADAIVRYQTLTPEDGDIGTQFTDKIVQKAVYYAVVYNYSAS